MKYRAWAVLLAVLVWGVGAREARAAGAAQVEDLIRQGIDLRHKGLDSRALPLFQQAYDLERTPRSSGQLGLCELALGYFVDAEAHISEATSATGNPWVEKYQADLAQALDLAHRNIGTVEVTGPAGAKVFVDGQPVGTLPLDRPLRLNKGPHNIDVRTGARVAVSRSLAIMGADEQAIVAPAEVSPPASVAAPAPTVGAIPPGTADEPSMSRSSRRTWAWVTAGVGAAGLVLGGIESVAWSQRVNDFDNHKDASGTTDCGSGDLNYGGAGCAAVHEDLVHARTWALVGLGAAAVFGGTAIFLFATSSPPATKTNAMSCTPDVMGRGIACRVSF